MTVLQLEFECMVFVPVYIVAYCHGCFFWYNLYHPVSGFRSYTNPQLIDEQPCGQTASRIYHFVFGATEYISRMT